MVILTDLSDVLVRGLWGIQDLIERDFGKPEAEKFVECHNSAVAQAMFQNLLRGKISEGKFWRNFIQTYGFSFTEPEISALFSENLAMKIDGTLDVYKDIMMYPVSFSEPNLLVAEMPRIILVSDHVSERIAELWSLHKEVFDIIDLQIWSCNVGKIKRDPGFFQNVLEVTGITADQAILVDDMVANTRAAWRDAKIRGIQFVNADQLQQDLEACGFVF